MKLQEILINYTAPLTDSNAWLFWGGRDFIVCLCGRTGDEKPQCTLSMRRTGDDGRVTVTNEGDFLWTVSVEQLDCYLTESQQNNQAILYV